MDELICHIRRLQALVATIRQALDSGALGESDRVDYSQALPMLQGMIAGLLLAWEIASEPLERAA